MADEKEKDDDAKDSKDALKESEKRASAAERKLGEIEKASKKREADELAAAESKKVKDLDDAKSQLELSKKREVEATARIAEYEAKEQKRVEAQAAKLPDAARAKVEKLKGKLSAADWAELVQDELDAAGGGASPPVSGFESGGPAPQHVGNRNGGKDVRALHPKTAEILSMLGEDPRVGAEVMTTERDPGDPWKARHVYSAKALVAAMKERATKPTRMDEEAVKKVIERGKAMR